VRLINEGGYCDLVWNQVLAHPPGQNYILCCCGVIQNINLPGNQKRNWEGEQQTPSLRRAVRRREGRGGSKRTGISSVIMSEAEGSRRLWVHPGKAHHRKSLCQRDPSTRSFYSLGRDDRAAGLTRAGIAI
jgi:hypothetical protein